MHRYAAAIMIFAGTAFGQAVRFDSSIFTTNPSCVSGKQCPVLAVPGTTISITTDAAGTIPATTYTSASGSTPCGALGQLTPAGGGPCVAATDSNGNFGFWATAGSTVWYRAYPPAAPPIGPYPITLPGNGGGGSGVCGSSGQLIFNNSGTCGASASLTWNGSQLATAGALSFSTSLLLNSNNIVDSSGYRGVSSGRTLIDSGDNAAFSVVRSGPMSTSGSPYGFGTGAFIWGYRDTSPLLQNWSLTTDTLGNAKISDLTAGLDLLTITKSSGNVSIAGSVGAGTWVTASNYRISGHSIIDSGGYRGVSLPGYVIDSGNNGTFVNLTVTGTCTGCGGGGGGVTWPTSGYVVISAGGTSNPTGLAPVNGNCLVGAGGAWTVGSCSGSGTSVNSVSGTGIISNSSSTGNVTLAWTGSSGGIPYFSGATTTASSAALGATQVVLGGGAGAAPNSSSALTFASSALVNTSATTASYQLVSGATYNAYLSLAPGSGGSPWKLSAQGASTNLTLDYGSTSMFTLTSTGTATVNALNSNGNIILNNGSVIISPASSNAAIVASSSGGAATIILTGTGGYAASLFNNSGGSVLSLNSTSTGASGYLVSGTTSAAHMMTLGDSGGSCTLTGAAGMSCTSDIRKKTAVSSIATALDRVSQIRPIEYEMRGNAVAADGFDAAEVRKLFPRAVMVGEDGYLQLSYTALIPYLWRAVQELSSQVKTLEPQTPKVSGYLSPLGGPVLCHILPGMPCESFSYFLLIDSRDDSSRRYLWSVSGNDDEGNAISASGEVDRNDGEYMTGAYVVFPNSVEVHNAVISITGVQ